MAMITQGMLSPLIWWLNVLQKLPNYARYCTSNWLKRILSW